MPNYVPGAGNSRAKIFFLGEAPGKVEDERQEPFVGSSGAILDSIFSSIGIHRSEVWISNIHKYKLPGNVWATLKKEEVEADFEKLKVEIQEINPNIIVPLGEIAFNFCTGLKGITKWRGSILQTRFGVKCIPTYHPAHLLHFNQDSDGGESGNVRKYYQRWIMQADIERAVKESSSKELNLPRRTLIIARHSGDLWNWIRETKDKDVASDIEATYSIPATIALSCRPWTTSIILPLIDRMALHETYTRREIAETWKMLQGEVFDKRNLYGQNFKFDDMKMELYGFQNLKLTHDTLLAGHTLYPEFPRNLGFLTSICTREPYYKDEGKPPEDLGKKFDLRNWLEYNGKDSCVTGEITDFQKDELKERGLEKFFEEFVMPNHYLYKEMEKNGFHLDYQVRAELQQKYVLREKEVYDRICAATKKVVNLNSPAQVKELLYVDLKLPVRTYFDRKKKKSVIKSDEDTLIALLANNAKTEQQKITLEGILEIRKLRKTLSTYLMSIPDYDGKMKTTYFICGTETGRSSTQKLKPPTRMKVLRIKVDEITGKKTKSYGSIGATFQNQTKHGIGSDIRRQYVASPGYILLNCDYSQAEPRIVALLAKDEQWQKDFADGIDTHARAASWIFGGTWEDWGKKAHGGKECPERFQGKTARNAYNYAMGKRRLMIDVNTGAKKAGIKLDISEWRAGEILKIFDKKSPNIKNVFQAEVEECLRKTRLLRNPWGRERLFMERMDNDLLGEGYAQIPQSTVPDTLRIAMRKLQKEYTPIRYIVECHDAFTAEVPEKDGMDVAKLALQIMPIEIDFSQCSLPRGKLFLPAEAELGYNYDDMESVKL